MKELDEGWTNGRFQDLLTDTSTGMNGHLPVISVEITSVLLVSF